MKIKSVFLSAISFVVVFSGIWLIWFRKGIAETIIVIISLILSLLTLLLLYISEKKK